MTDQRDKAALLTALRKPAITQSQLDEVMAQASTQRNQRWYVALWRISKESTVILLGGMALWFILAMIGNLTGFEDWLYHAWIQQR